MQFTPRLSIASLLALFTLVSPTSALAAGCSDPQSGLERTICSRPGLLDLDKQVGSLMDQLFAAIKRQGGDEQVAARDAAAWSDRLRSCGSDDIFCVEAGYNDWIAAIKSEVRALETAPLFGLVPRHSPMLKPIRDGSGPTHMGWEWRTATAFGEPVMSIWLEELVELSR